MDARFRAGLVLLSAVCGTVGCVELRSERISHSPPALQLFQALPAYRVGCPDVLKITFANRPDWDCLISVDLDGTLPLPESLGRPRGQGLTLDEIRLILAEAGQQKPETVNVELADARTSRIYVSGPDNATTRTIPYRGPEPVLDLLDRVGAMQRGRSNLRRVYVLRPNVLADDRAAIYHVDVEAALLDDDQTTNVVIQPGDHIYVGETRRSSFSRLLPAWAKPIYQQFAGMFPHDLP